METATRTMTMEKAMKVVLQICLLEENIDRSTQKSLFDAWKTAHGKSSVKKEQDQEFKKLLVNKFGPNSHIYSDMIQTTKTRLANKDPAIYQLVTRVRNSDVVNPSPSPQNMTTIPSVIDSQKSDSSSDSPKATIPLATLEETVESIQSIDECNTVHSQLEMLIQRLTRKRKSIAIEENDNTTPTDEETDDLKTKCPICWDAPKTIACVPCGHICMCTTCAETMKKKERKQCPMCMLFVQSTMQIYF